MFLSWSLLLPTIFCNCIPITILAANNCKMRKIRVLYTQTLHQKNRHKLFFRDSITILASISVFPVVYYCTSTLQENSGSSRRRGFFDRFFVAIKIQPFKLWQLTNSQALKVGSILNSFYHIRNLRARQHSKRIVLSSKKPLFCFIQMIMGVSFFVWL